MWQRAGDAPHVALRGLMFYTLFEMWKLVIAEFGIEACDKGDTLYWRWQAPITPIGSA